MSNASDLTIVTGIWNIGRDRAGEGFQRPFSFYTDRLAELLACPVNMVVYVEPEYEEWVWRRRSPHNTRVVVKHVSEFITKLDAYPKIEAIRTNPEWYQQAEWLSRSPQATLRLYNPLVMSKYFMLHDQACLNPFNTNYFLWVDGGITSTVHPGYFIRDQVFDKIIPYLDPFLFISFPYTGSNEIHGFTREKMNQFASTDAVTYVCRGGIFGGRRDVIQQFNSVYYHLLNDTLAAGGMGTEECIFTLLTYRYPTAFNQALISATGLLCEFFEHLKNSSVQLAERFVNPPCDPTKLMCYVLSFNSPAQFKLLCESWSVDPRFAQLKKVLVNNSTQEECIPEYDRLCNQWGFEHIRHSNLGICGGRQWVAEHFAQTDYSGYLFLEDDMLLNQTPGICSSGFTRYVPTLIDTAAHFLFTYSYDFLKLSFTEFYGNNGTQWAWFNVPQPVREQYFPEHPHSPTPGVTSNAPLTQFNCIHSYNNIGCIDGEVYYCNWPQLVSYAGNRRLFLDTVWARPFEQTWMSHIYQQTRAGKCKGAVLLASPITHHRFDHYPAELRKES